MKKTYVVWPENEPDNVGMVTADSPEKACKEWHEKFGPAEAWDKLRVVAQDDADVFETEVEEVFSFRKQPVK